VVLGQSSEWISQFFARKFYAFALFIYLFIFTHILFNIILPHIPCLSCDVICCGFRPKFWMDLSVFFVRKFHAFVLFIYLFIFTHILFNIILLHIPCLSCDVICCGFRPKFWMDFSDFLHESFTPSLYLFIYLFLPTAFLILSCHIYLVSRVM